MNVLDKVAAWWLQRRAKARAAQLPEMMNVRIEEDRADVKIRDTSIDPILSEVAGLFEDVNAVNYLEFMGVTLNDTLTITVQRRGEKHSPAYVNLRLKDALEMYADSNNWGHDGFTLRDGMLEGADLAQKVLKELGYHD